jgi:hypothetical protein
VKVTCEAKSNKQEKRGILGLFDNDEVRNNSIKFIPGFLVVLTKIFSRVFDFRFLTVVPIHSCEELK